MNVPLRWKLLVKTLIQIFEINLFLATLVSLNVLVLIIIIVDRGLIHFTRKVSSIRILGLRIRIMG